MNTINKNKKSKGIIHKKEKKLEHKEEKMIPHTKFLLLENKHRELEEQLKRVHAEFENFQKRTEKEMEKKSEQGKQELMKSLLGVIDEIEEAKKHIKEKGVLMIFNNLKNILEANGLEEIKNEGQYCPEFHEVMDSKESEKQEGEIIKVIRNGYVVSGFVLRPSLVIISKGKEKKDL